MKFIYDFFNEPGAQLYYTTLYLKQPLWRRSCGVNSSGFEEVTDYEFDKI